MMIYYSKAYNTSICFIALPTIIKTSESELFIQAWCYFIEDQPIPLSRLSSATDSFMVGGP